MIYSLLLSAFLFFQNGFPFYINVSDQVFNNKANYSLSDLQQVEFVMDTTRVKYVVVQATLARGSSAVPKKKIEIRSPETFDVSEWITDKTYNSKDQLIIHAFIHMNSGAVMDKYYIFGDISE